MFDVAIIGGGVCGCSLLYELSRYRVNAVLLEKENDVGVATTKANSAIVHAGYDPEPGTAMARYNVEGNRIIEQLCHDLDILYKKIGSFVLGFSPEDREMVEKLYQRGIENGVPGLRIVEKEELHQMEPSLADEALFALYAPSAAVVNPWELASAQAEAAVDGGAKVMLDTEVKGIKKTAEGFTIETSQGQVKARFVVNAAGTHSDRIAEMVGDHSFRIVPNRGEYFLLDTTQGKLVQHVIFQCPTKVGKGVLVSPTVHGNLIVGPNAEDTAADDVATTAEGLQKVREAALKSVPSINFRDSIRNFAGIRAVATKDDFIVGPSESCDGFFHIAGIKSPGLSSAPAIARDVVRMLESAGLALGENPNFTGQRKVLRFKYLDAKGRGEAIRQNPLYGTIVCRCETVTEGEIVDALHRSLAPRSVDGIKRRCTPGMGRCQGGFCGPRVQTIIARELGIPKEQVPLDRAGMKIIVGRTKEHKEAGE